MDGVSITSQTFYHKSYQNSIQSTEYKETVTETGDGTTETTAFMEGVVIEPVYDRTSVPEIADQLPKHVSKYGWTSYVESRLFTTDGSLWKPDLKFKKDQKIVVVDVTLRYENDSKALEMAWREKSDKYKHLNAEITELTRKARNPSTLAS
ncbi:hypothetical protein chiPu_0021031 [Chiloscyllium punctatum]|uniref:Uncharacterized protein n=1 Tax=Chiloscyllium punctatum TaxID=137246 RepID=A0A401RMB6_CHIPU|nr:hypothetical protein [Chiloscyllium punctatum]